MKSQTYFIFRNSIDGRWKVVDRDGFPFADCTTKADAIAHARDVWGITEVVE